MIDYIDFVNFKDINYFNISIPFENHHEIENHDIMTDPEYQLPDC